MLQLELTKLQNSKTMRALIQMIKKTMACVRSKENEHQGYIVTGTITFVLNDIRREKKVYLEDALNGVVDEYPFQDALCRICSVYCGYSCSFESHTSESTLKYSVTPVERHLRNGQLRKYEAFLDNIARSLSRMNLPDLIEVRSGIEISNQKKFPAVETFPLF
jgi:hypothetical protein